MGGWYTIGLVAGLGVALGVALGGLLGGTRAAVVTTAALAGAGGAALGLLVWGSPEAVGGGVGGVLGGAGASPVVGGTLRRGGTRGATALLVGLGAVVVAALAFIPVVGYVEAVVVPALAARLRRRGGRTYAGLRVLARD
jgi:hypothetical protein